MLASTKRALIGLAIALSLVGTLFVDAVRELAELWNAHRPQTVPDVGMPVSKSGTPWHETDVVMSVFHEAPLDSPCRDELCMRDGHWHVVLSVRGEPLGTRTSLDEPWQARSRLLWLREVADLKTPDPSGFSSSEATVAIRCPANSPYAVVAQLITDVARSRLRHIEYVVTSADLSERLLQVPLRNDDAARGRVLAHPGIRVMVERWTADECERRVEYRRYGFPYFKEEPPIPGEMTTIAKGSVGDAQLEALARDARQRDVATEFRIGAKYDVPFQAVVDAIDVLRAAGVEQIDFDYPSPR